MMYLQAFPLCFREELIELLGARGVAMPKAPSEASHHVSIIRLDDGRYLWDIVPGYVHLSEPGGGSCSLPQLVLRFSSIFTLCPEAVIPQIQSRPFAVPTTSSQNCLITS